MQPNAKPVRQKDEIPYTCRLCGNCCRDIEDQVMLEALDAYHLGRHLQEHGGDIEAIEDVYGRYAHPIMLEGILPVFVLNTWGSDHTCVFLWDGRCSVYEARPRVCRLYPFSAKGGQRGRRFDFFQCDDQHVAHFKGHKIKVNDWMHRNFTRDDQAFIEQENTRLPELSRLLREMDDGMRQACLFHILYYRYYNYDLNRPFFPQYERNHRALVNELLRRLQKEG